MEALERLTRPWNQVAALLVAGTGLVFLRRWRVGGALMLIAGLWLWLVCTPVFALLLQRSLVGQYASTAAQDYPKADAIVVLGGGVVPNSRLDWDDDETDTDATRVGFGLQLFQADRAGHLLVSGSPRDARRMAHSLQLQGVPERALLIENASRTTHQNARYSAAMLKRDGLTRILLVTSPIHMPRAVAAFQREGLEVIPAPSIGHDRPGRPQPTGWWPSRRAMFLSSRCLHEIIGLWTYRLRGWA